MLNKYGDFNDTGDRFIINTLDIERNWYNYFYTDNYISFTSQVGIGQGFLQDRLGNRITPVASRGVYAAVGEKGWNLAGLPVNDKDKSYKCEHGLGYTVISLTKNEIATDYGIFVPNENSKTDGYEVIWVTAKNTSRQNKSVKIMVYADNYLDGGYTYQGYNIGSVDYTGKVNGIHYGHERDNWNGKKQHFESFIVCGQPLSGYDCAKNAFIGPYGSVAEPKALYNGGCTNSACIAEKFGFAVQTTLELAPNEEKTATFILGVAESCDKINELTARFDSGEKVKAELNAVKEKYTAFLGKTQIKTPDKEMNKLCNNWLKYQTVMGSRWARVRHNGYRDLVSDIECLASFNPSLAWERIKRLLSYQYSNGYAPRTFENGQIKDNHYSDCTVWLTFAVYYIISELGDIHLLNEEVPYNDGSVSTVYEHLRRSVDFLYHFRGLHDLIRIWGGDWNDCMNLAGMKEKGVSVWLTIAWYRANKQFGELAMLLGDEKEAALSEKRGEEIRTLIDKYGWDEKGQYYIYAYNDDDRKIGSSDCDEGRIFLNPQTWAVMSGISLNEKEKTAMESAERELTYELGTAVSAPAYTKFDDGIGVITAKPAGVQENGGVYLHAMCWKLAADALLKKPDRVEWDINAILPFRNPVVGGRAEPYVLCNCYMGKETGYRYGTPGQSWRTATGQWFLKAMLQFVFGINPTVNGIELKPCLPQSWDGAEATKEFRGTEYHIVYKHTGKSKITVDGEVIDGNLLAVKNGAVEVICEY